MELDPFRGVLVVDVETCSASDLPEVGSWPYSQHPSTIVWCVCFVYGESKDGPRRRFAATSGEALDAEIAAYLKAGGLLVAHNAAFEKSIWQNILTPQWGWPPAPRDQWRDTQPMAQVLNYPTSLEGLAKVLHCPVQKDLAGAKVMHSMMHATPSDFGDWDYPDDPIALETVIEYCVVDCDATLDCYFRMPPLSLTELRCWLIDQRINERGVRLDQEFALSCSAIAKKRAATLNDSVFGVTGGQLSDATGTPALKAWLTARGVDLPKALRKRKDGSYAQSPNLDKHVVQTLLDEGFVSGEMAHVLRTRQESSKATSLSKLKRVSQMVGSDGRLRWALEYYAALTGRWSSRGFQLHNLPKDKMRDSEGALVRLAIELRDLELLELVAPAPLNAISQCLRSVIVAAPGHELIAADYSAIEARVIAWLADQDDVLELFRRGEDVYVAAAAKIGSDDRQLGKLCTLALGYGMGDLKFVSTAAQNGIFLPNKEGRRVKRAWREGNWKIVDFWYAIEDAVRGAIQRPGHSFLVSRLIVKVSNQCLYIRLPSGRSLRYWKPKLVPTVKTIRSCDDEGNVVEHEMETDEIRFHTQGRDKKGMREESTYSGKLAENVTQAIARDLLAYALRIDDVDPYRIVMHVHDSIVSEVPKGAGDVEEFSQLMAETPGWADGLPFAVEGYRDVRFRG